jgi:hypothetical protein
MCYFDWGTDARYVGFSFVWRQLETSGGSIHCGPNKVCAQHRVCRVPSPHSMLLGEHSHRCGVVADEGYSIMGLWQRV